MAEFIPFLTGLVIGPAIWNTTRGRTRITLSLVAIATTAALAMLISGEYIAGWMYTTLDLCEVTAGMIIGVATTNRVLRLQRS